MRPLATSTIAACWHCSCNMRQGLCNGTLSFLLSACPPRMLTAASACSGFAAVGPVGRRYQSTVACVHQRGIWRQMRAVSHCQLMQEAEHRLGLFIVMSGTRRVQLPALVLMSRHRSLANPAIAQSHAASNCTQLTAMYKVAVPSVLWRCWLGGRKGIRPVKNWVVGCWRGYLSGARFRLAYGPADATATHCLLLQ